MEYYNVDVKIPMYLKKYLDRKGIKISKYIKYLVNKDILDKRSIVKRKYGAEIVNNCENLTQININKSEFVNKIKNNICLFFNAKEEFLFRNDKKGGAISTTAKIILCKILYENKHHNFNFILKYIADVIGRSHCNVLYYRDNYFNNKYAVEFHEQFNQFEKIFFNENNP